MKRWLVIVVLLAGLLGQAAGTAAAPTTDTVYIVRPGDTLTMIAARFGVPLSVVVQANHISNVNLIFVGQRLTIPGDSGGTSAGGGGPASGGSPCASPYVVQAGDTLGLIAGRCATSVSALLAANPIQNINLIFVGQRLTIPGGAPPDTALPPAPTLAPTPTDTPPLASGPLTLANPSFEDGWTTDGYGNQAPNGWTVYAPPAGATMPFPTKGQQGATVPALSDGLGENVHKLAWQLPPEEQLGQPRALILDGGTVYKSFDLYHAHALQLSQVISGPGGRVVRVTVYILGETHDTPCSTCTQLENDHFVASVRLGAAEDRRSYASMTTRHDISGNQRAWNQFAVTAPFPASGQLPLVITIQSNWGGRTDFFIDAIHADLTN